MLAIFYYLHKEVTTHNQRPSKVNTLGASGEYIRLVPDGNIIEIPACPGKAMIELPGIVDRGARPHISVTCGRKMDTERSWRATLQTRNARHDLPPAPVSQEGTRRLGPVRSGNECIPPFGKLDNRAIGRRLPGRTTINDYGARRGPPARRGPVRHSQQT